MGQENPLGQVNTPAAPPKVSKPAEGGGAEAPGSVSAPRSNVPRLRVTANLVLVPMDGDRPAESAGDGS